MKPNYKATYIGVNLYWIRGPPCRLTTTIPRLYDRLIWFDPCGLVGSLVARYIGRWSPWKHCIGNISRTNIRCFSVGRKEKLGGGFKYFYFLPYLERWSNLTNIFEMGWNHQLENDVTRPNDPNGRVAREACLKLALFQGSPGWWIIIFCVEGSMTLV